MEARHDFLEAGGKQFHYIPCLNEESAGIAAIADIAEQHMSGWPTQISPILLKQREEEARLSATRAKEIGADT